MLKSMQTLLLTGVLVFSGTALFLPELAVADAINGRKQIFLMDKQGNELFIGVVSFTPQQEGSRYTLHIDHASFQDYFLSMKEMKCLEGGPELMCHLPYPYKQPNTVNERDLSWLSHDLLFMFKKKEEFGANFWNGIFYNLRLENGVIIGKAEAVDLNLLASPPHDLSVPPMNESERDEVDRDKRWLPDLVIRAAKK